MDSIFRHAVRLLSAVLVLYSTCYAQAPNAKPQGMGMTRDQADQILQELRQIRQLLETERGGGPVASELRLLRQAIERQQAAVPNSGPAPAAPPAAQNAKVNISGLQVLGRRDAPLTMVEFSDYQCPFCRAFHSGAFEQIKKEWIDAGKLRFVSWDLPLDFHSNAAHAAHAARCAGEQNKFWEFRSILIANAAKLSPEDILGYAQQLPQLDLGSFKSCVQSDKYTEEIKRRVADGNRQGISGTPTFLIARTSGDVVDGVIFIGAQPYAAFDEQLKQQLGR